MRHGAKLVGRLRGSMFFTVFGTGWLLSGLTLLHRAHAASVTLSASLCLAMLSCAWLMLRREHTLPFMPVPPEQAQRATRMMRAVNIIQGVAILTAAIILQLLSLSTYLPAAIAIIVGLHLFPMGETLHSRVHFIAGGLLIVWSLRMLLRPAGTASAGLCALGVGAILLGSAATAMVRAFTFRIHTPLPVTA